MREGITNAIEAGILVGANDEITTNTYYGEDPQPVYQYGDFGSFVDSISPVYPYVGGVSTIYTDYRDSERRQRRQKNDDSQ
jgi:hypothetical protein